ncbi:unnamed protein product [Nyctereutes procyonoides]|uniref:(raccoon dog) hypothetical protein n=1 Tax=Nyctereutes procyonoides TaxID=34880 RepID=A0A811YTY2_NYCPR|nr:unnamed protein product [Nyctereutes procyonoides]
MLSGAHSNEEGSAQMWKALPYFVELTSEGSLEFAAYDYLFIRSKPFLGGDGSHSIPLTLM